MKYRMLMSHAIAMPIILCALAQKPSAAVTIWTGAGPIKVERFERLERFKASRPIPDGMSKTSTKAPSARQYAFAVFEKVPATEARARMEKTAGIRFLSVHDAGRGAIVYLVRLLENPDRVRAWLSGLDPGFYNLEELRVQDKLTAKILSGKGFQKGEMDPVGKVMASIEFFPDVAPSQCRKMLEKHCGGYLGEAGTRFLVSELPKDLRSLGAVPEIRSIREMDTTGYPTHFHSRELTQVNSTQDIDTTLIYPPSIAWLSGKPLTGTGVSIGIYDSGIDSVHLDFRERSGADTVLRRSPADGSDWFGGEHGTHVAAIAAGNGWLSSSAGSPRLHWRGVAPKSLLINRGFVDNGEEGDVNNHSFVPGSVNGDYDFADRSIDEILGLHQRGTGTFLGRPSNIIIYAAANNGGTFAQYGNQKGYYSILAEPKNAIVVGSVDKENGVRSRFSSMGPTRDGRIKPDIMAPGGSANMYPGRNNSVPMTVEMDFIRILDSTGTLKFGWEFETGAEGWGVTRNLGGDHGALDRHDISPPTHSGSVLRFDCFSFDSYLWSDSIAQIVRMGNHDTLYMRYRILHPEIADYGFDYMQGRVYWKRLDSTGYENGFNSFPFKFSNNGFFELKHPMQGWSSQDTLLALRLDFAGDTATRGVFSAHLTDSSALFPSFYFPQEGTSMAAPHTTGIVALMLQKYNENYLLPSGRNIEDHAFWNSTAKALLVHTATDLIEPVNTRGPENPDTRFPVFYHAGPDYATGWGLVNAARSTAHVNTALFKEDSLDHAQEVVYSFVLKRSTDRLRVTLAWDDTPGNPDSPLESPKLVNQLDMMLHAPDGTLYRPWVLDPLPQKLAFNPSLGRTELPENGLDPIRPQDILPAYQGYNDKDNIEVIDVARGGPPLPVGEWIIRVKGTQVCMGPQDFSLVADDTLTRRIDISIPDSLHWKFSAGGAITTAVATNVAGSTAFFGVHDSLLAVDLSGPTPVRLWSFAPLPFQTLSDPVIAGNRLYVRAGDSLYCLSTSGSVPATIWKRGLVPEDGAFPMVLGDTGISYSTRHGTSNAPALDLAANRLYVSSGYSVNTDFLDTVTEVDEFGNTFFDTFFSSTSTERSKLWVLDTSGNIIDTVIASDFVMASPSAARGHGYFVDQAGLLYKISAGGYPVWSRDYIPEGAMVRRQPVIGPNFRVMVQSDSQVVSIDESTGDSIVTFGTRWIASNSAIDNGDVLYFVGFENDSMRLYICYPNTAELSITALERGFRTVGELAMGSDGLVYFALDNLLLAYDRNGVERMRIPGCGGLTAPAVAGRLLLLPSESDLYGYGIPSPSLMDGWAGNGADAGHTSHQNQTYPGLSAVVIGDQSQITSAGWNAARTKYSQCGNHAGLGGVSDDLGLSFAYKVGDFDFTLKVDALSPAGSASKAGIMALRDDAAPGCCLFEGNFLNDNAIHGFVWMDADLKAGFSRRTSTGALNTQMNAVGNYTPGNTWIRLKRTGETLFAFISQNGVNFSSLGNMAIGPQNLFVGPAYTSGNILQNGCADFSHIATSAFPASGAQFSENFFIHPQGSTQPLIDFGFTGIQHWQTKRDEEGFMESNGPGDWAALSSAFCPAFASDRNADGGLSWDWKIQYPTNSNGQAWREQNKIWVSLTEGNAACYTVLFKPNRNQDRHTSFQIQLLRNEGTSTQQVLAEANTHLTTPTHAWMRFRVNLSPTDASGDGRIRVLFDNGSGTLREYLNVEDRTHSRFDRMHFKYKTGSGAQNYQVWVDDLEVFSPRR